MPEIHTVLQGYSLGTSEGSIAFCSITLVRGERTYLVDTGHPGRRRQLIDALKVVGLAPGDIDAVFLTHSHWDHILNVDMFPDAEVLLHRLELEYLDYINPADLATVGYTRKLLDGRRLRALEDGEVLERGLSVLLTPGHTRGSSTLLVDTPAGVAGIAGDALPVARSVRTGLPTLIAWSEEEARASVTKIMAHTRLVYPGHDRPFRIVEGGTEYLGPMTVTVTALVEPEQDNVAVRFDTAGSGGAVTVGTAPPPPLTVFPR